MSSKYVRDTVEAWLKDAAIQTPYYPTVNLEQNPQDDIWFSAEYSPMSRQSMDFCGNKTIENGEIELIWFGLPGIGYDLLIAAMEHDIKLLMSKRDPDQKLVLMEASAPFEATGGSAEMSYEVSTYIEYIYFD